MRQSDAHGGEVGYLTAAIKTVGDCRVGDTITCSTRIQRTAARIQEAKPMVSAALPRRLEPVSGPEEALARLQLNDASLTYEPESSAALGLVSVAASWLAARRHRAGAPRTRVQPFADATAPSVIYKVHKTTGEVVEIDNPQTSAPQTIAHIEEPLVDATLSFHRPTSGRSWNWR